MNMVYWGSLLGLLVLQLIIGFIAWRHLTHRLRDIAKSQQQIASTDVPTSMLVTSMARIEARLKALESARAPHVPDPIPVLQSQPVDRTYQLAQRMAHNGATAAEIAEACGIASREAELLCHLHAPTREGSHASPP